MKITNAQWQNVLDTLHEPGALGLRRLLDVMVSRAHQKGYDAGVAVSHIQVLAQECDELAAEVLRLVSQDVRRRHDAERTYRAFERSLHEPPHTLTISATDIGDATS